MAYLMALDFDKLSFPNHLDYCDIKHKCVKLAFGTYLKY